MQFLTDFSNYESWSGATSTVERIKDAGKWSELESHLEEVFSSKTPTATEINDYLWFQPTDVYKALGMKPDEVSVKTADEVAEEWCGDNGYHFVKEAITNDGLAITYKEIDEDDTPYGDNLTTTLDEDALKDYMIEDNVELNAETNCVEYW